MIGRIHQHVNFKGANTASANTWLMRGGDGPDSEKESASEQFAIARTVLNRKNQKRTALLVREAEAPIDAAIDAMVQQMRGGRLRVEDVRFTQQRELDMLKGLTVSKGDAKDIARLRASTAVRAEALGLLKSDPYMNVVAPVQERRPR